MRLLTSASDLAIADRCSRKHRTEKARRLISKQAARCRQRTKADGALGFAITTTRKIIGTVAAQWWIAEQDATPVARGAPLLAGLPGTCSQATAAVVRSAASLRAVLTPDDAAISRASAAVVRLDAMVEANGSAW